jgi:hypothetical protein
MPRGAGHQHGSTGGWLTGGTIVPVTWSAVRHPRGYRRDVADEL